MKQVKFAETPEPNNSVIDSEKYLESIISTFKSLDDVIYEEIKKGTSEDVIKVLELQIEKVFHCIADFQPNSDRERELLVNFSIDMIEERIDNSRLASSCLNIIRRSAGGVADS